MAANNGREREVTAPDPMDTGMVIKEYQTAL